MDIQRDQAGVQRSQARIVREQARAMLEVTEKLDALILIERNGH